MLHGLVVWESSQEKKVPLDSNDSKALGIRELESAMESIRDSSRAYNELLMTTSNKLHNTTDVFLFTKNTTKKQWRFAGGFKPRQVI